MRLSEITGNKAVVDALEGMISSGRIPHALMFYENDGGCGMQVALSFLETLMDSRKVAKVVHPDVHFTFPIATGGKIKEEAKNLECNLFLGYFRDLVTKNPYFLERDLEAALGLEGKSGFITIREGRSIISNLSFSSVEGGWKAVVIYLPEKMRRETANSLLKSFEEPPENTIFLMVTHNPDMVLQTITSRCQCIKLMPLSKEEVSDVLQKEMQIPESQAVEAAAASGGSVGVALAGLSSPEVDQERMNIFKTLIEGLISKDLMAALDAADAMAGLDTREKQKAFCKFAEDCLRKVFFIQQNMPELVSLQSGEKEWFLSVSPRLRRTFPRGAVQLFDRAHMLIDRNVNQKVLFSDMVNKLYLLA
ncbi:MAG: hypothetical protein K5984_07180 [Bacteroidales bacterium]|nr:hypothetical protein [Bacteroidales bacterium]